MKPTHTSAGCRAGSPLRYEQAATASVKPKIMYGNIFDGWCNNFRDWNAIVGGCSDVENTWYEAIVDAGARGGDVDDFGTFCWCCRLCVVPCGI